MHFPTPVQQGASLRDSNLRIDPRRLCHVSILDAWIVKVISPPRPCRLQANELDKEKLSRSAAGKGAAAARDVRLQPIT